MGSTWGMVPVRLHLQGRHGPLPRSVACPYPVTPLGASALSDAFDKWDAINAPNLGQPVQPYRPMPKHAAWTPSGGRLMVVLGPRLVPNPSEPNGPQRSLAVHHSRRRQMRSGNRSGCRTLIRMRSRGARHWAAHRESLPHQKIGLSKTSEHEDVACDHRIEPT